MRSIRRGDGAIPFPTPTDAAALEWTDEDRELVRDRVLIQFVGSPKTVGDKRERPRDASGSSEVSITTITHDHIARVRSYELIANGPGVDRTDVTGNCHLPALWDQRNRSVSADSWSALTASPSEAIS